MRRLTGANESRREPSHTMRVGRRAAAVFAAVVVAATPSASQDAVPIAAFVGQTHVHGLAFDPGDPAYLFIATHHGLYRSGPDGMAVPLSIVQDFMGFTTHPADPTILFASGHPAGGGNLGFLVSTDGGRTWVQRSLGVGGPVDFHQMAISPVDPNVIYGAYGQVQVSMDAGMTWRITGPLPPQMVDLAASAVSAQTLFAATQSGLYVSTNAGANWRLVIPSVPVSLVEVAPDGSMYAFVLGQGLLRAADEQSDFVAIGSSWVEPYLFHLTVDPADPSHFVAATASGRIVQSRDRGLTWAAYGQ